MNETELEKWDRGRTLLLESLYKPDDRLRGCAYNQGCYDEMMALRDHVIELIKTMDNPHSPPTKIPFGKKNNHIEPISSAARNTPSQADWLNDLSST